jgi:hypothetical protein
MAHCKIVCMWKMLLIPNKQMKHLKQTAADAWELILLAKTMHTHLQHRKDDEEVQEEPSLGFR